MPGHEPADDVSGSREAKLREDGCGKDRRAAVVAEQDDLSVESADMGIAKAAVRCCPPFEHGARDVERAAYDPVPLAVAVRADIDQQCAGLRCCVCFGRRETLDPRFGAGEQVIERASVDAGRHLSNDVPFAPRSQTGRTVAPACQRVIPTQIPLAVVSAATSTIAPLLPATSATIPAVSPPATNPVLRQKR